MRRVSWGDSRDDLRCRLDIAKRDGGRGRLWFLYSGFTPGRARLLFGGCTTSFSSLTYCGPTWFPGDIGYYLTGFHFPSPKHKQDQQIRVALPGSSPDLVTPRLEDASLSREEGTMICCFRRRSICQHLSIDSFADCGIEYCAY